MSDPTSLAPHGLDEWLHLLGGALLFLAPGLAAVDRFIGLRSRGWMFAPVFSFSLLPLGAIVLDLALHVPITAPLTVGLAVFWTLVLLIPRLRQLTHWLLHAPTLALPRPWRDWTWRLVARHTGRALLVGAVLAGVAGLHYLPHLPGDAPANVLDAGPQLVQRWTDGAQFPYPIHVDEHYHMAQQAQLERAQEIGYDNPYTGEPSGAPLFSVSGFREERGFQLALVQLHDLTGLSFMAQARLVPALQSALLAGVLYATLGRAPGALVAAGLTGLVPTTVRFLGPGFLVPSAFALPWILTALHVSLRAEASRRLAALALIETAAFFLHLVPGTLTLAAAALGAVFRPGRASDRLALLLAALLPLLWVLPLVFEQVVDAVGSEHDLPFQVPILFAGGWLFLLAAIAGTGLAFALPRDTLRPHKALVVLTLAIAASLLWSIQQGHHNDATYSRLIPFFFVCLAALAGLAIGYAADGLHRIGRERLGGIRVKHLVPVAAVLLAAIVAVPGLQSLLETPYYRVFNATTWDDGRILLDAGADADDVFLSDPWRAPIYNSLTAAQPAAVLYPGRAPVGAADWTYYLRSGGATPEWLAERSIDFVIAPVAPNAPHEHVAGNVYRILEAP